MIATARLDLIPATLPLVEAALAGSEALDEALEAAVPESWPHEFLDEPALQFTLRRLGEGPRQHGWWLHFVVLRQSPRNSLIGSAGYKGPPAGGMVEVGYGIVADQRRRGYASEAVRGLLGHAFAAQDVERVIAETYPSLIGSIGVLEKTGFQEIPGGSEPGVIRFQITRSEHSSTHFLPRPPGKGQSR